MSQFMFDVIELHPHINDSVHHPFIVCQYSSQGHLPLNKQAH